MNKLFCTLCILIISTGLQAKELQLVLQNQQSPYPMSVHYKFSNGNHVYAEGDINNLKKNEKYFIFVNRVPDDKEILVQIDKMTLKNVTVFNDPCEIYLTETNLRANIIIGFKGDTNPEKHNGAFTCNVALK